MGNILYTNSTLKLRVSCLSGFFFDSMIAVFQFTLLTGLCLDRIDSVSEMGKNMAGAAVIMPDNSDGSSPENPFGD